jgi:hypothetical protein
MASDQSVIKTLRSGKYIMVLERLAASNRPGNAFSGYEHHLGSMAFTEFQSMVLN